MSPVDWLNVAVQAPGDAFGLICVFGYCNMKNIMKYYCWIFFIYYYYYDLLLLLV